MTRVAILGRQWKVSVLEGDDFLRRFGEECAGFTIVDTLEIVVHADELTMKTVIHELVHAYYDGTCVSSAELNGDQIEEVFCELLAEHGARILKQAKAIYKELRDLAA